MRRRQMETRVVPVVTAALVAANIVAYVIERAAIATGGDPCNAYGLVPAHFEFGTVFTSMFMHDPSNLVHIVGNMIALAFFGTMVERMLGSARFMLLYVAAGIGGALVHVIVDWAATTPLVGASGSILGVMAACAMLRPRALAFVASYFAFNLLALVLPDSTFAMHGVALGAHVGGFCVGAVFVVFARPARGRVLKPA